MSIIVCAGHRLFLDFASNRLYVSRKEGGSRLASIKDNVGASMQGLGDDIKKNKERLITVANNCTDNIRINRTLITRKQKLEITKNKLAKC